MDVDENVVGASTAAEDDNNQRGYKVNKMRIRPTSSSFHHGASEKGLMEKLKE